MPSPWSAWQVVAAAATVLAGLVLRFNGYETTPGVHDNPDDAQFAWLGLSLIEHGRPITWSAFDEYQGHVHYLVTASGRSWPIVDPWFDHPPVFGLLIGSTSWLGGVRTFVDDASPLNRFPVVMLGVLALVLVGVLGRRVFGQGPALVAMALYATAPGAVLFARSVEPEAALAPLLLGCLVLVHRHLSRPSRPPEVGMLLGLCVLAPMMKVPGVAVAGICGVILLSEGRPRLAAAVLGAGAAGVLLFVAWGAVFDWRLFWLVWQHQAGGRFGVANAWEFIAAPAGLVNRFRDAWWLLGWLGIGALLAGSRRSPRLHLIAWPAIAYAATMLVMTDQRVMAFGWYRITIYPLVYMAAAWLLWLLYRRASPGLAIAVLMLGGATAANLILGGRTVVGLPVGNIAAVAMLVGLAPAVIAGWRRDDARYERFARWAGAAVATLILIGNIAVSLNLERDYLTI
ncbi:MAG: hypothetical protein NVS9B1_20360 [Candidatus Dormibacteraceae bacterium]